MSGILDFLNNPVPRDPAYSYGGLLPFRKPKAGGPAEWGLLYSDAVAGLVDMMTAPARAYKGQPVDVRDAMGVGLGLLGTNAAVGPLVSKAGGPGTLNQIVFHGSPHKFDAFDASKIGTGEGAQAYGHGLYFAENPKVARNYADELSQVLKVDGRTILEKNKQNPTGNWLIDTELVAAGGDLRKAELEKLNEIRGLRKFDPNHSELKTLQKELSELRALRGRVENTTDGNLYHVDLPDSMIARMLDWDKPLSQQAPEVQKALGVKVRDFDAEDALMAKAQKLGVPASSLPEWKLLEAAMDEAAKYNKTGGEYVQQLAAQPHLLPGFKVGQDSRAVAAQQLRSRGIPGIRYLDGMSRNAGQGSSNYVVFPGNEGMLKILRRE